MARPPRPDRDAETDVHAGPHALAPMAIRGCPEVRWTDTRGTHRFVLERRALAGSSEQAELVISDPTVSRLHAELDPRSDGVWLRDLGSRNGTFVGDVMITQARIPPGGVVRLGTTALTVGAATSPTAVDLWPEDRFGPLAGRSVAMRELFARLARVAATDSTVLVQGETGTGKELVARAIHEASHRASGPYVVVDCAALPENLLDGELFGHARGAFTGAVAARAGALESAEGGTVFLDEVGELPLAMQPKLLRAIESRTVRRLGESHHRSVDVRFVSATHRDLREMVNAGAFREDLYFRLAVVPLEVPPLRARRDDIALLVERFLPPDARAGFGPDVLQELAGRPWIGNVRELRNFVSHALALGAREALQSGTRSLPPPRPETFPAIPFEQPFKAIRERWVDHLEREYIRELLKLHGRNTAAVAHAAGLDRAYVYRLMKKHDL